MSIVLSPVAFRHYLRKYASNDLPAARDAATVMMIAYSELPPEKQAYLSSEILRDVGAEQMEAGQ